MYLGNSKIRFLFEILNLKFRLVYHISRIFAIFIPRKSYCALLQAGIKMATLPSN
jgi:hypothetical protein